MHTQIRPADAPSLREAVRVLRSGALVALPTETVYGLAADGLEAKAVATIFTTKQRPVFNPLILHLADLSWLNRYAEIPATISNLVNALAQAFWPGPLTMVLPRNALVPDLVSAGLSTAAFRVPSHPVMRDILQELDRPLAAPSANRSGRISPTCACDVLQELNGLIPLIIDGGPCEKGLESTIVQPLPGLVEGDPPFLRVLREGPITRENLARFARIETGQRVMEASETPSSPGQLASHYAPTKPVILVDDPADFSLEAQKTYALLQPDAVSPNWNQLSQQPQVLATQVLAPATGSLEESATRLFRCLRLLDEGPGEMILAPVFPPTGLGAALMDRLTRAAANRDDVRQ
jgi:L-threonylcarbamoyladenylate synthase